MRPLVHPMSVLSSAERDGGPVYESGSGPYLTDTSGHTVIDGFSGLWCVNLGYGRQSIVDAVAAQMSRLPYATCFFNESTEVMTRLATKLAERLPGNLNHTMFTLGGSDADDTAMKIALYYHAIRGEPSRQHVISLEGAYHGSSWAGAGLSGLPAMQNLFGLPFPTQHQIPSHYLRRLRDSTDPQAHIDAAVADLEDKLRTLGPGNVAAFICELVQGAGGVIVPPDGLLPALQAVCRKHGVLFVVDEVITGFCRSGTYFGIEREGLAPDIITLAKGLTSGYVPLGATVVTDEIYGALVSQAPEGSAFSHGFTYSGHPTGAAAALECIRLYDEEVCGTVQSIGDYFQHSMRERFGDHPWVTDVRGRCMLLAVELSKSSKVYVPFPETAGYLRSQARLHGLRIRVFGNGTVGFAPPLVCSRREVDLIVDRFEQTLDDTVKQFGAMRDGP
jgi:putrescine aminotransferase